LIGKDGKPEKIEVLKGLGNVGCNESAVDAVGHVKFTPVIQRNKPVRFWSTIPIRFELSD